MGMVRLKRSLSVLLMLSPIALGVGCAGPPFPVPIGGEPVCPDFELGPTHVKMNGSLRYPVRLRLLKGKDAAMKLVLDGKRAPGTAPAYTYIADDNAEYTVEWAQCVNERAPFPVEEQHAKGTHAPKQPKEAGIAYECGEATVYKTDTLVTKKHDPASHALSFVPPPKPECWVSDTLPAADAADAGAPEAGAVDAGEAAAAPGDAGPAGDAGAAKSEKPKDDKPKDDKPKDDKPKDEKPKK